MKRNLAGLLLAITVLAALVVPAGSQVAQIYTFGISNAPSGTNLGILNIDGGNGATNGITLGAAATAQPIKLLTFFDVSLTPGSQAANTCAPQSFTVTGVTTSDHVVLTQAPDTGNATGYGTARASAANTVKQVVCNPTAGALTPAAGIFTYMVFRR